MITVDIYYDAICPWCYVGKRRFERAVDEYGLEVDRRWRPYQLNPGMPRGGMDRSTYLLAKFGSRERVAQMEAVIEEAMEREGLPFRHAAIARTPNTVDAHRLILFASRRSPDLADRMVAAVFEAYFAGGQDIGDPLVLESCAENAGLDRAEARAFLAGGDAVEEVRALDTAARMIGVQAVPCFVFADRYAIAGAQDPQAFTPLFDLVRLEAGASHAEGRAVDARV